LTPEIFTVDITVTQEVIDDRNHVNNLAYLQWCMEAATQHWQKRSTETMREQYIWYVLHHDVHYKAATFLGEQLQLKTWVSKNEGVRSERSFEISRIKDAKLIMHAKTTWCLLNTSTQKPIKITDEIRTLFEY